MHDFLVMNSILLTDGMIVTRGCLNKMVTLTNIKTKWCQEISRTDEYNLPKYRAMLRIRRTNLNADLYYNCLCCLVK